jgi:hypothetical protein
MNPQHIFDALDGRDLSVSRRQWRLKVFSVSDHDDHRWVQVGLEGPGHYMLTLRLDADAGPQSAIAALSSWLDHPEARPRQILNVA